MSQIKVEYRGSTSSALVVLAIGVNHYNLWSKTCRFSVLKYCQKYGHSLLVVTDFVERHGRAFEIKPTWQKFLIPKAICEQFDGKITKVCFVDADVVISHRAPDFELISFETFACTSLFKNLPFNRAEILRKLAFLRKKFIDPCYPLSSFLHADAPATFQNCGLKPWEDMFCAGVFFVNVQRIKDIFYQYYIELPDRPVSVTGGDQPYLNDCVFNHFNPTWVGYEWQTIWNLELANNFSGFFDLYSDPIILRVIKSVLDNCYILHFAGTWPESSVYKNFQNIYGDEIVADEFRYEVANLGVLLPNQID